MMWTICKSHVYVINLYWFKFIYVTCVHLQKSSICGVMHSLHYSPLGLLLHVYGRNPFSNLDGTLIMHVAAVILKEMPIDVVCFRTTSGVCGVVNLITPKAQAVRWKMNEEIPPLQMNMVDGIMRDLQTAVWRRRLEPSWKARWWMIRMENLYLDKTEAAVGLLHTSPSIPPAFAQQMVP